MSETRFRCRPSARSAGAGAATTGRRRTGCTFPPRESDPDVLPKDDVRLDRLMYCPLNPFGGNMSFRKSAAVLITAAVGLCALGTGPAVGSTFVAAGSAPAAVALTAAVPAPADWTVTASKGGYHLVWTTDRAVMGDAQVQFFAGDRLLG